MSDTTYIITVLTRIDGKQKKKVQKCGTEKQAAEAFKKECLVFTQDKTWIVDPNECTDTLFIGIKTFPDGSERGIVTIDITKEVNLDYYIHNLFCAAILHEPDKICKIARTLYRRGYNKGLEEARSERR